MKYGLCLHDTKTKKDFELCKLDLENYHFIFFFHDNKYKILQVKDIEDVCYFKTLVYTSYNEDYTLYSPYEINDSFIHVAITGDFNKDTLTISEYEFICSELNKIMKKLDLCEFIFFSDYTNNEEINPGKNLHYFEMKQKVLEGITNLYADEEEDFVWE